MMKTPIRLPLLMFVALFLTISACSDALVDVESDDANDDPPIGEQDNQDPQNDPDLVPVFRLGAGYSVVNPGGSGSSFHINDGLITVDGKTFSDGFRTEGEMSLRFFFGYVDRASDNPEDVGLFIYSDEPFEGAVEAGFFEGQALTFTVGGHDVVIESRGTDTPLLGDGGRTSAYAMHVADFTWDGYETVMGSSPDLDFILNRDSLEWEFDLEQATVWINGTKVKDRGASVKQTPFDYFFMYSGEGAGDRGLFIVSNRSFQHAEPLGLFEGQRLQLEAGGNTVVIASEADALLGDGAPIPAWVRYEPDFVWTRDGQAESGVILGVTSDLQTVLDRNASKRGVVFAQ